jgi:hypothetical protein
LCHLGSTQSENIPRQCIFVSRKKNRALPDASYLIQSQSDQPPVNPASRMMPFL